MSFRNCIIFHGFLLLYFLFVNQTAVAQENLAREFQLKNSSDMSIREALDKVAEENGFYFSYQSTLVEVDNPVTMDHYQGSIAGFLAETLGDRYEFKEIPGYIIIRYAPGILDLDADLDAGAKQFTIKGYVKDLHTQENISFASVYERNNLVSALTDHNGYFELRLRHSDPAIWLTLSKENYKDTTFMMLPAVDIQAKRKNNLFRYFPDDGSVDELEQSFFGRMFIGFRQRFQRINLGGFFVESPFQMSLTPGLSSQGMFNSQMINNFSFNVLGGYTAGVDGFEMAGIFNLNQKDVQYFQIAGIFNIVGGNAQGVQVAGIHNMVYKSVSGVQVAGIFNQTRHFESGLQVAGLVNNTKQFTKGLRVAGLYNHSDSMAHHQIAGLANIARETKGLQVAGLFNSTMHHAKGLQLAGLYNRTNGAAHHQIAGLVNQAKNVKGVQFAGLLNIAESSDYPIGFVNFIKNGKKSLALGMDESSFAHLTFRSGGRVLYGLLGSAYQLREKNIRFALEAGLGIHLYEGNIYSLDLELVNRAATDFRTITHLTNSLKFLNGFNLNRNTRIFAGPTLNVAVLDPDPDAFIPGLVFYEKTNYNGTYGLYAGFMGGVQYVF